MHVCHCSLNLHFHYQYSTMKVIFFEQIYSTHVRYKDEFTSVLETPSARSLPNFRNWHYYFFFSLCAVMSIWKVFYQLQMVEYAQNAKRIHFLVILNSVILSTTTPTNRQAVWSNSEKKSLEINWFLLLIRSADRRGRVQSIFLSLFIYIICEAPTLLQMVSIVEPQIHPSDSCWKISFLQK